MPTNTANCAEIKAGEAPPVDESLFFDNVEIFKNYKLDEGQVIINKIYSVFDPQDRKLLLEMEKGNIQETPDGKLFPECSENFKHMAFLYACFHDLFHLLPKFEKSGVDPHWVAPATGINSVTAACFTNSYNCLEYLIKRGVNVNHENPITHRTCLSAAAIAKARESAELLLDNGAKLNLPTNEFVEPNLHCAIRAQCNSIVELFLQRGADVTQRNHQGETPLHVACSVQSVCCAKMLLSNPNTDVNALDQKQRTPLHFTVMSTTPTVELLELLLKNGAFTNVPDESGFTALHIAALNEQSRCVERLIWAKADLSATTNKGISALKIILMKIPDSLMIFRKIFDASIRLKRPSRQNREFEMRLELKLLFPSDDQCESKIINTFIQENQTEILCHPLIKAFLHLKWQKIKLFYIWNIFMYTLAIVSMTIYVITGLAYNCYNVFQTKNDTICNSDYFYGLLFRKRIIEIEWYTSICLMCFLLPRKIFSLTTPKASKLYFSDIENILDIVVLICNLLISFIFTKKTYVWQKIVGAFAILCAWMNLMFMIRQLPFFGTYVTMFTHVQVQFAKLLLAYSGLFIGFMTSFCVFFNTKEAFNNLLTAFIKVLSMMVGDLDFDRFASHFNSIKNKSFDFYNPLSIFSQLFFCLFVILITIILMNLLVGIIVHDIRGLINRADITKLSGQIKRSLFIELELSNKNIPYFIRKMIPDHRIDLDNQFRVLTVKPLNPLEKRLPKEILTAAYEIAQKNPKLKDEDGINDIHKCSFLTEQNEDGKSLDIQLQLQKLTMQLKVYDGEMPSLNDKLYDIKEMLMKIPQ